MVRLLLLRVRRTDVTASHGLPRPPTGRPVGSDVGSDMGSDMGSDVGRNTFATLSEGQEIATPRFFRREEHALAQAHRRLSQEEQGPAERAKRRTVVARVHERARWRRGDFTHQRSRRIVNHCAVIAGEDVSVNRMAPTRCLATSIHDAAWSQFASLLSSKAAWAARR